MSQTYQMIATCLFGLEKFVGEDLERLGLDKKQTIDGRVSFCGDASALARANLTLSTAERVLIEAGAFEARSFDALFEGTKAICWENFIGSKDAFPVKGHTVKSELKSIPDCQRIIKKAIVERLKQTYRTDWFEETGKTIQVEFFVLNDRASIMIDTTGAPLHKRGYRPESGVAPLRETLASALVRIAHLRPDVRLWDPLCGSGTIPIEACFLLTGTAPGLNRRFAAERYDFLPHGIWSDARERARSEIRSDSGFFAFGSDIDTKILTTAQENARRAGFADRIRFFERDACKMTKDSVRTTIICNPPYGERMNTLQEARSLSRCLGERFSSFAPWQIYFISSDVEFERFYGRRADKKRKLYNGMIPCTYYQYFKNAREEESRR